MPATDSARIAVVGAGAIGGWAAARLALAGHAVALLARGETLAALAAGGLEIDDGRSVATAPVTASDNAAGMGEQDIVLIAVKAPALAAATEAARPLIGPGTVVVPLLNGVP